MSHRPAVKIALMAVVCIAICIAAIAALRWHLMSPMDTYVPLHDGTGRVVGSTYATVPSN